MKNFSYLYQALDQTTKTNAKIDALVDYFKNANDLDKLWLLAIFSGRRVKRAISSAQLRNWSCELANVSDWLFDECYQVVGDMAETIAKILPPSQQLKNYTLFDCISSIITMQKLEDEAKKKLLFDIWTSLNDDERFVFNKLLTGGFRVGVSQTLVYKALSRFTGIDEKVIAHRLMGNWSAIDNNFNDLIFSSDGNENESRPYPFCLAYSLDIDFDKLGSSVEWFAEWKWDGIRGQIIKRNDNVYIWSRGEELVTDSYPELIELAQVLPNGSVLDGEILTWDDTKPGDFQKLQTRINKKKAGKKLLQDAPVVFMAYDLLELDSVDLREHALEIRRKNLESIVSIVNHEFLKISKLVQFDSWDELAQIRLTARSINAEGLMLKNKNSIYESGRKKGEWWKWKLDPITIDAVLIYAQAGHGRRANLFTDYTFAVWDGELLVPFAKAYSGLTDIEIIEVDKFIKSNTKEKFGPVRSVKAELVFELGFEGINFSSRHKSGIAVRFPRILRWRKDKSVNEANTLEDLKSLINQRKVESQ